MLELILNTRCSCEPFPTATSAAPRDANRRCEAAKLFGHGRAGSPGCAPREEVLLGVSCHVTSFFHSILHFHLLLAAWPPPLAPSRRGPCAVLAGLVMRSRLQHLTEPPVCRANRPDDFMYPHLTARFCWSALSLLPHRLSLPPLPSIPPHLDLR
ncbi:hypothetical protein C8J57DRAFT_1511948 [Mycena rebaudengoi]|nr:hypothetical protein C8J57DRAFT_1511948 [Mycena rebaudengoi]